MAIISLQMWERLPGGLIAGDHRSATCPTGIHADGPCSCETILMSRETGSRASISRIVMLAEALFEVIFHIATFWSLYGLSSIV